MCSSIIFIFSLLVPKVQVRVAFPVCAVLVISQGLLPIVRQSEPWGNKLEKAGELCPGRKGCILPCGAEALLLLSSGPKSLPLHCFSLLLKQEWITPNKNTHSQHICPLLHHYMICLKGFGKNSLRPRCNALFWIAVCVLCTNITTRSSLFVPTILTAD